MYLICVSEVDEIFIRTVYQWNPFSSGVFKIYFVTRSILLFP